MPISAAIKPPMFAAPVARPMNLRGAYARTSSNDTIEAAPPVAVSVVARNRVHSGGVPGQASTIAQESAMSKIEAMTKYRRFDWNRDVARPYTGPATTATSTIDMSTLDASA